MYAAKPTHTEFAKIFYRPLDVKIHAVDAEDIQNEVSSGPSIRVTTRSRRTVASMNIIPEINSAPPLKRTRRRAAET